MAETKMNVSLIAHPQLNHEYIDGILKEIGDNPVSFTSGQAVALTAIRTCYSPGKPSEIVAKEGAKYFGSKATDGAGGSEADRLFRMIVRSGHTSTLEHISFTFAVEGVSRALLAQLTRHRVGFSFSVQSQRYVRFGSGDRSGGFDYVIPDSVAKSNSGNKGITAGDVFDNAMAVAQSMYDQLRSLGVPSEDARAVLPNAAACNLVLTTNLRALLDFYAKRQPGKGAQGEIAQLAEEIKAAVISVEPWTQAFFEA